MESLDLIILVADKNMEHCLKGLLPRIPVVYPDEISPFTFEIRIHPLRDPGCRKDSAAFLRPFQGEFSHSLVLLDHEGSGAESRSGQEVEREITDELSRNGWESKCDAIVIEPELEQWMWINSPNVSKELGWGQSIQGLKDWLQKQGHWPRQSSKPPRPKEAFELALRQKRIPRSSSIYEKISKSASFKQCEVSSFHKLIQILKTWFPHVPIK